METTIGPRVSAGNRTEKYVRKCIGDCRFDRKNGLNRVVLKAIEDRMVKMKFSLRAKNWLINLKQFHLEFDSKYENAFDVMSNF